MDMPLPPTLPVNMDAIASLSAPAVTEKSKLTDPVYLDKLTPRQKHVRDAACAVGVRGGMAESTKRIRSWLDQKAGEFDIKFQFGPLLLQDGVIPPVVTETRDLVSQEKGGFSIRYADTQYRMEVPAQFVTVTPTWRDWLYTGLPLGENEIELPSPVSLPRTEDEKIIWSDSVKRCWDTGRVQARSIFEANMSKLERDYTGMVRYRILAARNVISSPVVKTQIEDAIRRAGELTISDVTKQITHQPAFDTPKRK